MYKHLIYVNQLNKYMPRFTQDVVNLNNQKPSHTYNYIIEWRGYMFFFSYM
jgi:hypothetical protein